MDLSIPLAGLQTADAAFNSAAASIVNAFTRGATGQAAGDSVDLSTAVAGLLASKLDFIADEKVALVEDNLNQSNLSVLG